MIRSVHKIQASAASGGVVLLDVGDRMSAEPAFDFQQPVARFGALGAARGRGQALGNIDSPMEWTRQRVYSSVGAARLAMLSEPSLSGVWASTDVDVTISDGVCDDYVLRIFDFTLEAMVPRLITRPPMVEVLWSYRATGGDILPVSGVLESPGMPASWSLTPAEDQEWIMEDGPPVPAACVVPATTPTDPGGFAAGALAPVDPGAFASTAPAPVNPGDFDPTNDIFSPVLIAGTLSPDATGEIPSNGRDVSGNPQWLRESDGVTVTWSIADSKWQILMPQLPGFVTWLSPATDLITSPFPWSIAPWAPGIVVGGGGAPTGVPTVTEG